jgi:hypothetical protein
MTEMVLNTTALPETLFRLIQTEKVRVREIDGMIQLIPFKENNDYSVGGLRGMFAGNPNMTVDKFLERKRSDKELER